MTIGKTHNLATKAYYQDETAQHRTGMTAYTDLGYSLDIPWNNVYNTGWLDAKPTHADGQVPWGTENQITLSNKPEFFAPSDVVRSNVLPSIDMKDPRYHYSRADATYRMF